MLFNSLTFVVFFVVVYGLYLALAHRGRNRMLLVASYVFYGAWDWRFLSLIILSTVVDYFCALGMHETSKPRRRRTLLGVSVAANLGILGFFKYFNFFAANLAALAARAGLELDVRTLNIVLPVGISFYTFQTMSYTIDVYRREMAPTRRFLDFALFVAFFPQLVAGPIERARHLLPQVLSPRRVTLQGFAEGFYLMFWGMFQKVFVADNLARTVDPVFNADGPRPAGAVWLATYAFAFQIFCDFAGYSNIARGLGRCMGFDIMVNFNVPYSATNPSEFWRRWHISLSTWLRDYLYIPLGGNRNGPLATNRNLALTMLLGGLWHGAAWNFIVWGAYHGFLLIAHRLLQPLLPKPASLSRTARLAWKIGGVALFFHLTCVSWVFFRARSLGQALAMLREAAGFGAESVAPLDLAAGWRQAAFAVAPLLVVQFLQRRTGDVEAPLRLPAFARWTLYLALFYLMAMFGAFGDRQFIYFQF